MAEIEINRIGRRVAYIPVRGTAPLIVNRFDEKAKAILLGTFQGKAKQKEAKNPEAEFERSLHRLSDNRTGFPATGFKAATVGGARYYQNKKMSMTLLKQALFVIGEGPDMLVPIEGAEPKMREDYVRQQTTVNLRYRGMYWPWNAVLGVVYVPALMSLESVVNLVDAGGMGGVGEWRPSSKTSATGVYGTFEVNPDIEIKDTEA